MLTLFVLRRKRAFRYTPGVLERNSGLDSGQEENVDGSPVSPAPPYLAKTSSSEWNSSDDLAGPPSEQEESSNVGPLSAPPVPPKTYALAHPDIPDVPPPPLGLTQSGPRNQPRNGPSLLSHNTLRRWIETPPEHRFSSDTSSKSGSSDQDRTDPSASESDERAPSPNPGRREDADSPGPADVVLPTTYFSVDNCMTDTYRAQYHRRPAQFTRAEEHTSSGESDAEWRRLPGDVPLTEPRTRPESGTARRGHAAPFAKCCDRPGCVRQRRPRPGGTRSRPKAWTSTASCELWTDPGSSDGGKEAFEASTAAVRPGRP